MTYSTQEDYTYLKILCIINYIVHDILLKLLQESQMTHLGEEFWMKGGTYEFI